MVTIDELLEELEQEARHTRHILSRVPSDRMQWRPHEKSLTLGQLAMHVATLPGALAEVSTRPFDVNTPIPRPGASSTAELLETMERSVPPPRPVDRLPARARGEGPRDVRRQRGREDAPGVNHGVNDAITETTHG